jgi:hypothetical protein
MILLEKVLIATPSHDPSPEKVLIATSSHDPSPEEAPFDAFVVWEIIDMITNREFESPLPTINQFMIKHSQKKIWGNFILEDYGVSYDNFLPEDYPVDTRASCVARESNRYDLRFEHLCVFMNF